MDLVVAEAIASGFYPPEAVALFADLSIDAWTEVTA